MTRDGAERTDGADAVAGTGAPAPVDRLAAAAAREVSRQLGEAARPGLHLVATPIGNLGDITLRALATLAAADLICCEDTRHSRTLLAHYGIDRPLRPYHEHNADAERPRLLQALAEGRMIALISDAGTPLVSDPGFKLVRAALEAGHTVRAVPGASAVLAALSVAGEPTDTFLFAGFLPPKSAARRTRLAELARTPATLVLFEAANRTAALLADIAAELGPRPVAVARELTKRFEEVRRGSAAELAAGIEADGLKGEVVVLVGPPLPLEIDDAAIEAEMRRAMATESLRDAARLVAERLGIARSRAYETGLKLKSEGG